MPRFVLLYHTCPPDFVRSSHWDVMLEAGDALETWALFELPRSWKGVHAATQLRFPNCPPLANRDNVTAEKLAAHRLEYLEYEGPLSGMRGEVVQIASGSYRASRQDSEVWSFNPESGLIHGHVMLSRAVTGATTWTMRISS